MKAELKPITSKPRPGYQPDADGKKPFWCHCGDCGHDFAPFWVPMPVAEMPKDYRCPRCRSKRSYAGKNPAGA